MLFLMLGILCTALFTSAIAVYIFHDVDQDKSGHWTEAFAGLFAESVLFTLIVGGSVWLLTLLGRRLFHLRDYSPRATLGLFLGIGLTVFQYPWEFAARKFSPTLAESALSFYLVIAIVLCTVVLLRDNFRQMKLRKALETELSSV